MKRSPLPRDAVPTHGAERSAERGGLRIVRGGAGGDDPQAQLLPLLYRQMRALVGRRADLDDLVQMAAERALRSLPTFDGRSALSTWTYSIAYHTLLDHERWYRRWARRFALTETERVAHVPTMARSADALYDDATRAARLRTALDRLPPEKRTVIVLCDLEERSVREIADIVGANELTVRSRLRDGRKKLAALLSADPSFQLDEGRP